MLGLINSIWLESGKDLSGEQVCGQLPTFPSLLNALSQMDESCSQAGLWLRVMVGEGEKVGLRPRALGVAVARREARAPRSACLLVGSSTGRAALRSRAPARTWGPWRPSPLLQLAALPRRKEPARDAVPKG